MRHARFSLVLMVFALTGCGWLQSGYDGGKSNSNDFEATITTATIGQLVDHVIPGPASNTTIDTVLTVKNRLLVHSGTNVYAYDTKTCPTTNGSPCAAVWQVPATRKSLASDGQQIFIGNNGVDARNLDGALLWHTNVGGTQISVSNGRVFTTNTRSEAVTTSRVV